MLKKNLKFFKINKLSEIIDLKEYIHFVNDKTVMKYSQHFKKNYNEKDQKKFILENIKKGNIFFQVFCKKRFIGILLIKNIDVYNKNCMISYLIGNKSYWGKGFGSYIVNFGKKYCIKKLKLNTIYTFVHSKNIASIKVLKKNNFLITGKIRKFYKVNYTNSGWDDKIILSYYYLK